MSEITGVIANLQRKVTEAFPGVRTEVFNCRPIADSSTWSQHAWGNAIDVYPASTEQGWLIFEWAVANKTRLSLSTICWQDRGGCDPNDHRDHVHIAGSPKMVGTPPCVQASGSRSLGDILFSGDASDFGIGGPLGAVSNAAESITSIVDFLKLLTEPETWLRVAWFIGGVGLTAGGVAMFMKELGYTVPLPPQAKLITSALKG